MKRLILITLSLLLILLGFAPVTHAAPMYTGCSSGCSADQEWSSINTHGALTNFIVDNPVGGTNFGYFAKYIDIQWSNGNYIEVGIDHGEFCPAGGYTTSALRWFYYVVDPGDTNETGVSCGSTDTAWDIPLNYNADINKSVWIGTDYESSGTNAGINVWIYGDALNSTIAFPLQIDTDTGEWSGQVTRAIYQEDLKVGSFTGHEIWGGNWIKNQYYTAAWHYDGTTPDLSSANNPVQMGWTSNPNGSTNNGGTMISCAYDSGTYTSCNVGS